MTSRDVQIEPATPADIPAIIEMVQRDFRDELRSFLAAAEIEYMLTTRYTRDALLRERDNGHTFVKLHCEGDIHASGFSNT
jgi:hypothetical protein